MNKLINKKYLEKIDKIEKRFRKNNQVTDCEGYHIEYDYLLLELVKELGYTEIADEYNKASNYDFWYA